MLSKSGIPFAFRKSIIKIIKGFGWKLLLLNGYNVCLYVYIRIKTKLNYFILL